MTTPYQHRPDSAPPSLAITSSRLRRAALHLQEDDHLYPGGLPARSILLSLALELALKAIILAETGKVPTYTYDLLFLFKSLAPATQTQLNDAFLHDRPQGKPFAHLLKLSRSAHVDWRYVQDTPHLDFFPYDDFERALDITLASSPLSPNTMEALMTKAQHD